MTLHVTVEGCPKFVRLPDGGAAQIHAFYFNIDYFTLPYITLHTHTHPFNGPFPFTGRMPFLPPNQQRQSTEGSTLHKTRRTNKYQLSLTDPRDKTML